MTTGPLDGIPDFSIQFGGDVIQMLRSDFFNGNYDARFGCSGNSPLHEKDALWFAIFVVQIHFEVILIIIFVLLELQSADVVGVFRTIVFAAFSQTRRGFPTDDRSG